MKKRILTMLLALVMVLSLSTVAFADDGINTADELKETIANGGVIVVTGDITLTEAITISNTVTIKANTAVTITANGATDVFTANAGGNLTLGENIKVVSNTSVLWANGGTINIDGAEISVAGSNFCAAFAENNGTINVKAGSISQSDAKVTIDATNATVNVSGGTVHSENDSAIAARAGATVNITGGTVSTNATAMKAAAYALNGGKVVVNGGSVKSLNENATSYALVAGTGGAVDVQSGTVSGTKGAVVAHEGATASATISGGTITGSVGTANGATLAITGGTFSNDPSDYVAEGYIAVESDGAWIVGEQVDTDVKPGDSSGSVDSSVEESTGITADKVKEAVAKNDNSVALGAAVEEITIDISAEQAENALGDELDNSADAAEVKVEIKPYLNVAVKTVAKEGENITSMTLDIKAQYDVVAVQGDVSANISTGNALTVTNQTIKITVPLPAGFVTSTSERVVIKHYKEGNATPFEYEATVTEESGSFFATFENPNGFSIFVVEKRSTVSFWATSMVLEENIDIRFWIDKANLDAAGAAYAKVVFNGDEYTVDKAAWVDHNDGYYRIPFVDVAAKEMCDNITITVYDANGIAVSQTLTYTVGQAIVDLHNNENDAEMKALCVALLDYGTAAQKAFNYTANGLASDYKTQLNTVN